MSNQKAVWKQFLEETNDLVSDEVMIRDGCSTVGEEVQNRLVFGDTEEPACFGSTLILFRFCRSFMRSEEGQRRVVYCLWCFYSCWCESSEIDSRVAPPFFVALS